ncbi:hypothetical protein GCM10020000_38180 [Streptomyces olivoverticillatus]
MRGWTSTAPAVKAWLSRRSRGDDLQADGVRARLGLDDVLGRFREAGEVLGAVDGRDDRIALGAQVEEVLLADHVGLARQLVVDEHAVRERAVAEGVVGSLVVQDRAAVADDDRVEAAHQLGRVQRMAQGHAEVLAQPGAQEDVLVAVPAAAGLVGEVGDEQDAGLGGRHRSPGAEGRSTGETIIRQPPKPSAPHTADRRSRQAVARQTGTRCAPWPVPDRRAKA